MEPEIISLIGGLNFLLRPLERSSTVSIFSLGDGVGVDGGSPLPSLLDAVAPTTGAFAATKAQAMKDVRASGADDDFVAEGEDDLVRLTLFADESLRPAQRTVDANVTGERVVDFLHFTFQHSIVNGDEVLRR